MAAIVASFGASAQLSGLSVDFDATSPCFLGWETPGNFGGNLGREINAAAWDGSDNLTLTVASSSTPTGNPGPYYFQLNPNDANDCLDGSSVKKETVDLTTDNKFAIRLKASTPMTVNVLLQSGTSASWNYSNVFASDLAGLELTTEYQIFTLENIVAENGSGDAIDLTQVGMVLFEIARDEQDNYPDVTGTIDVDYMRFGDQVGVSTEEVVATSFNVFPNPATDVLNVQFDATSTTTVELLDITGKVVDTKVAQAGAVTTSFATANVNAGVYFVNVKNANGATTQKVVIK